jgi:hypothetical protein
MSYICRYQETAISTHTAPSKAPPHFIPLVLSPKAVVDSQLHMYAIICPHAVEIKRMKRDGNQDTMQTTTTQKKAIDHYYKELAAYHEKKVTHETAVRSAFQYLLSAFAQSANWVLIPGAALLAILTGRTMSNISCAWSGR